MHGEPLKPSQMVKRRDPPPLRIHHLLACAAMVAVLLVYWRVVLPAGTLESMPIGVAVSFLPGQIVTAVGLTFAIFSIYWHTKGYAALVQPGQWLLLTHLLAVLDQVWNRLAPHFFSQAPHLWSKGVLLWDLADLGWAVIYITSGLVQLGIPLLFYVWCAWRIADTWAWRALFTVLAVKELLFPIAVLGINYWGWQHVPAIALTAMSGSGVALLLALWASASDLIDGRRFWTHWLGIALFSVLQLLGCLSGVLFWVSK